MYEIEKNIPRPRKSGSQKFPLDKMEIDDSFFVPEIDEKPHNISAYLVMYGKRNNKKYTMRKIQNGYRIWRIN